MMLDWMADRFADERLAAGARALEQAVDQAFASGSVHPFEFGGRDGTREIASAVAANL
jgi:3-isopropylmalate dehydrogenase